MTDTEINAAMADMCPHLFERWDGGLMWATGYPYRIGMVDPSHNLNACHEAEKVLTREQIPEWERLIREITLRDAEDGTGLYERIIRATARQRCEAMLRTLGKWRDA